MRIAIIGGIGSGKSCVLKVAKELNLATLSCDEINAGLLSDKNYLISLFKLFPSCNNNGQLNKEELKKIIYSDENSRQQLNNLAHPIIYKKIFEDKRDPLIVEVPLFNEELKNSFDEVIMVDTPLEKRLDFLNVNRGMKKEESLAIIDAQKSVDELKSLSTIIICNDSSKENLIIKCKKILKELINNTLVII